MSGCNSIELTYYQKTDVILNRVKDYQENDKKRLREQARYKYRNSSEQEKNKRENMEKTDIIICLKKRKQRLEEFPKNYREAKRSQCNN